MVNETDCRSLAEQFLARISQRCGEELVLMAGALETPMTLAYSYQTAEFAATGDLRHALAGNGPILVSRLTGAVDAAGTALPVVDYIKAFEAKHVGGASGL